jgi:hypothetical protein
MTDTDTAKAVDAQLRAAHPDYPHAAVFERDPALDGEIASAIALLADGSSVDYVAIDQSRAAENSYLEVAAFTPKVVIRGIVSHGFLNLRVVGRHTLRSIDVVTAPNLLATKPSGRLVAAANYDEIVVRLPGDDNASAANHDLLPAFLQSLYADLNGSAD